MVATDDSNEAKGARLAEALTFVGASQSALARELEVTPSYINAVIHGRRPVNARILMVAEGSWGIRPDWIREGKLPMVGRPRWTTVGATDGPQPPTPSVAASELVEVREKAWSNYETAVTLLLSCDDGSEKARIIRLVHAVFQREPKYQERLLRYLEGMQDGME